jgi:hypothetical protein
VVDDKGRTRHEFTATAPNQVWLTGHPTPSTPRVRARSTCARSRTATPTRSSGTRSTRG